MGYKPHTYPYSPILIRLLPSSRPLVNFPWCFDSQSIRFALYSMQSSFLCMLYAVLPMLFWNVSCHFVLFLSSLRRLWMHVVLNAKSPSDLQATYTYALFLQIFSDLLIFPKRNFRFLPVRFEAWECKPQVSAPNNLRKMHMLYTSRALSCTESVHALPVSNVNSTASEIASRPGIPVQRTGNNLWREYGRLITECTAYVRFSARSRLPLHPKSGTGSWRNSALRKHKEW